MTEGQIRFEDGAAYRAARPRSTAPLITRPARQLTPGTTPVTPMAAPPSADDLGSWTGVTLSSRAYTGGLTWISSPFLRRA